MLIGILRPWFFFFSAVSKGKKNTVESYDTNLKMARNVAHAARSKQVLGVIFTSSIDIYGNCPINPLTEKSFIQANSWYSKSKKESEIILQTMLDGEIPLGIFRCPGIYDLSSCDRSVIGNFTRRAQENKILKVHNSGENMRDFIYAGDLYELFYLWFKKPVTGIWNVATGNSCSMLDVVEQIVKNVGLGSIEITEEGHRNFNQVFDCTAILETFGANPLRPFYDAFPDVYLSL